MAVKTTKKLFKPKTTKDSKVLTRAQRLSPTLKYERHVKKKEEKGT